MVSKKDKDVLAVPVPDGVSCDETVCTLPIDIQNDEFRGQGGSYVFDPATGKRTRANPVWGDSIRTDEQPATDKTETEVLNNEIQ